MVVEKSGAISPVADRTRPLQEILSWSEEAQTKLRDVVGAAPDFDALAQELRLAEVDDEVLQGFEARFRELLQLTDGAIGDLTVAIEAAQTVGDFAELLGGDDVAVMQENQRVLHVLREEVARNKETVARVLSRRELERTSAEREAQEKELFVHKLNRSGLETRQLFTIVEELDPGKAAQFIREKSSEKDSRWSKSVEEINTQYASSLAQIQQEREGLANKLVRSDQLKQWITSLGLTDNLEENSNEASKPLVVQLRAKGTYDAALAKVRAKNAEELVVFQAAEEPRLQALEAQAEQTRDTKLKNALLGDPRSRDSRYYALKIKEITPLLEDGTIQRDQVAQKIAEDILKRRHQYDKAAPNMTMREAAFLPKEVLDILVAQIDYEGVTSAVSADKKSKPAIFWSESFGEKLSQMRARYQELSGSHVFDPSARDSIDKPGSPSAKLFEVYKEKDNAYLDDDSLDYQQAIEARNGVFRDEIEGFVERLKIAFALGGHSVGEQKFLLGEGKFSVASHGYYFYGNDVWRSESAFVGSGEGSRQRRDRLQKLSLDERIPLQKQDFLQILGKIKHLYDQANYSLPPEDKKDAVTRVQLAEETQKIASDFAGLDAELIALKEEEQKLLSDVGSFQERVRGKLYVCSLADIANFQADFARIQSAVRAYEERVGNLRGKAANWGIRRNKFSQEVTSGSEIGSELRAEEKEDWERSMGDNLENVRKMRESVRGFEQNIQARREKLEKESREQAEAQERQIREQAEAQERQIKGITHSAEQEYRRLDKRAVDIEHTIWNNIQAIDQAKTVIGNIDRALEKNEHVTFGTVFGRKQTITYCDKSGKVREIAEVTAMEYKEYKREMEKLKEDKGKEIEVIQKGIANFKEELRGWNNEEAAWNLNTPFLDAQRLLTKMNLDEALASRRLEETVRLREVLTARVNKILS